MDGTPVPLAGVFGFFNRLYNAVRRNPCTIEVYPNRDFLNGFIVRLRNDSDLPTDIDDIGFHWRLKGEKRFNSYETPLGILLGEDMTPTLQPGGWKRYELAPEMIEGDPIECLVEVHHSRSPYSVKKRLKINHLKKMRLQRRFSFLR